MTEPRDMDQPQVGEESPPLDPRPFPHPPWTVGVFLILGAVALFLGIADDPLWLLGGSPFILTPLVWVGVRIVQW